MPVYKNLLRKFEMLKRERELIFDNIATEFIIEERM